METFSALITGQTNWLAERSRSSSVAHGHLRHLPLPPQSCSDAVIGNSTAQSSTLRDPASSVESHEGNDTAPLLATHPRHADTAGIRQAVS